MTMRAVGVDQPAHLRLLVAVDDPNSRSLSGSETSAARAERKTLEEGTPRRVNGVGILLPCFKCRFDQSSVSVGGNIERIHGKGSCRSCGSLGYTIPQRLGKDRETQHGFL